MEICCYSGGIDSIAVSHYMIKNFGVKNIYHFNHNCQEINEEMEKSARMFAADFKVNLIYGKCTQKLTSEASLREARMNFIKNAISSFTLITGHHLNDAVESYLMNCIRGHAHFLPIPVETSFSVSQRKIHPFLLIKKQELKKYLDKNNLGKYLVEDPTNKISRGSRRNMIRNEIIPIFEREEVGLTTVVKKIYLKYFESSDKPDFLIEKLTHR